MAEKEPKQQAEGTADPNAGILAKPDYLQGVQGQDSSAMSDGIGMSVPRISAKGKQFRFINGDDEIKEALGAAINVVILGIEPGSQLAKTFYLEGYQPGSSDPPDCSSWDGIRPDSWVNSPQSQNCAQCPQSKWGSATSMSGKKAKACKESKRLIVAREDSLDGQYYILTVTVSSLKALSNYGQFLAKNQVSFSSILTKISFADSDYPQFEFDFESYLPEEEGKAAISRSLEREWEGVVSSKPMLPDGDGGAPAQITEQTGQAPASAPADAGGMKDMINNW